MSMESIFILEPGEYPMITGNYYKFLNHPAFTPQDLAFVETENTGLIFFDELGDAIWTMTKKS